MIRNRHDNRLSALPKLGDCIIALLALLGAWRSHSSQPWKLMHAHQLLTSRAMPGCVVLLIVSHVSLAVCGIYRSRRLSGSGAELGDIAGAAALNAVAGALVAAAIRVPGSVWVILSVYWGLWMVGVSASRLFLRQALRHFRAHGRNHRRLLVVGTNQRAMDFASTLLRDPDRGYELVGFVDDRWPGTENFEARGFSRVATFEELPDFLRRTIIDEIAMFVPVASYYRHCAQIAALCEQHGIIMRLNADIFGLKLSRWHSDRYHGHSYVTAYPTGGSGWRLAVKRLVDVGGSSMLLLLCAPLLIAAALAIKLNSRGPIFFVQDRVGQNRRIFRIYKFRTMVAGAEKLMKHLESLNEMSGPVFKIRNDPRITTVGRILRRSSIDELPQLFNVLKGDMSLVGPRPLAVRDYNGFSEDWQRRRFSVKPGITCLWQISGRNTLSFDRWMVLDLQYMDEWSLWLDFKILAKTVPAVMRGEGAA
jgi:exopolysaccharide biosynthesis polyprenyl glycosylphosphotransferase